MKNKMTHEYHVRGTNEYVNIKNKMIEEARKLTYTRKGD